MIDRIKRICITRKLPRKNISVPAKQNAVDIKDYDGSLLARVEVWQRPSGGNSEIEIAVLSDPNVTKISRVDVNSNPPFPESHPLILNAHACPKCNGSGTIYAAPVRDKDGVLAMQKVSPPYGELQACDFCKRSGSVLATFYPNS